MKAEGKSPSISRTPPPSWPPNTAFAGTQTAKGIPRQRRRQRDRAKALKETDAPEEAKGDAASFTLPECRNGQDRGMMFKPREMPLGRDETIGIRETSGRERTLLKTALAGQGLDQGVCSVGCRVAKAVRQGRRTGSETAWDRSGSVLWRWEGGEAARSRTPLERAFAGWHWLHRHTLKMESLGEPNKAESGMIYAAHLPSPTLNSLPCDAGQGCCFGRMRWLKMVPGPNRDFHPRSNRGVSPRLKCRLILLIKMVKH